MAKMSKEDAHLLAQAIIAKYAEGGEVGGAETSTTGNKTKTGGSNPGGASTGGAGTVTITTSGSGAAPGSINVSGVGGTTESKNAGGMDPSDENDNMMGGEEDPDMMADGGMVGKEDFLSAEADTRLPFGKPPEEEDDGDHKKHIAQILYKLRNRKIGKRA